jgi:hypothetical protein
VRFESIQAQMANTALELVTIFERMNFSLENIAVKLGAVTREELASFQAKQKTLDLLNNVQQKYEEAADSAEAFADAQVVSDASSIRQIAGDQDKFAEKTEKSTSLYGAFRNKLDASIGPMNRIRLEIIATAAAMIELSRRASEYTMKIARFTANTGLSGEALQKLQRQAAVVGIQGDEVTGMLENLQSTAIDISLGRGNADAWHFLGMKPGMDPFKQLDQLQAAMNRMGAPMFTKFAKDAGLSDEFVFLLRELKDIKPPEENMIISQDEIKNLNRFSMSFSKAIDGLQIGMTKVGALLVPITEKMVHIIDRWGWSLRIVVDKWNAMNDRGQAFLKLLTMIGAVIALNFFPLTAFFTGLILLIDDVLTYLNGGDSLIGRFINGFKDVAEAIGYVIKDVYKSINDFMFFS